MRSESCAAGPELPALSQRKDDTIVHSSVGGMMVGVRRPGLDVGPPETIVTEAETKHHSWLVPNTNRLATGGTQGS